MNKKIYLALSLCSLIMGCSIVGTEPVVSTDSGLVEGVTEKSVDSFKGIPFAASPIKELRWRAPQPVQPWKGVFKATNYGHDCMQVPFPGDAAPLGTSPSEDCLVLNVWKPHGAHNSNKKPVMVWIYGGGFVNGGASPIVYDAKHFAEQGIVAVSFNYRVGRFGFFAHPALTAENKDEALGNYGIMDQIAALKWVKNNIKNFGGDPNNVTLVGESAGGFSAHTLLTSPMAAGLYNKAIIQSGSGRKNMTERNLSVISQSGLPSAEDVGLKFAHKHGIEGTDERALAELRNLSANDVAGGLNMGNMMDPTYSGPMLDGKISLKDPEDYYSSGQKLNIPLLVGTTNLEFGLALFAPPAKTYQQALSPFSPKNYAKVLDAYKRSGVTSPESMALAVSSDILMVEPARFVLREAAKQNSKVYGYRFGYVADSLKSSVAGALHATDIPYSFDTVSARYKDKLTLNDIKMAALVHQYWVNFIKFGDPNGENLPVWKPYNQKDDDLMWFSNKGAAHSHMISDPWRDRLNFVEAIQ